MLCSGSTFAQEILTLEKALEIAYQQSPSIIQSKMSLEYLGGDTSLACSAQTQREIDQKVVELVKAQHEKAVRILTDNRAKLDELAQYLYQKETITGEEFMEILNREPAQAQ